jgi:hypothetical protein
MFVVFVLQATLKEKPQQRVVFVVVVLECATQKKD